MATQIPRPEDGDRPEGPMPEIEDDDMLDDEAKPVVPIEEHPEDQNTG